nr:MAG TPA: DNA polymerase B [Caudoviricetes sp.]
MQEVVLTNLLKKSCTGLLNSDEKIDYYYPKDIGRIIKSLGEIKTKNKKSIEYYEIPAAFDIETSSFYMNGEKVAIMYEWTFGIGGEIIVGRTWSEFIEMYYKLIELLQIDKDRRLIIYIHNLSFEFQFFRHLFEWATIFSLEKRKPIQALTNEGIEFRCSYVLSGYALRNLHKSISMFKVNKKDGDLDYKLLRHSKTKLTYKEIEYCLFDVIVVMCYIYEMAKKYGGITKLPLTKTGFVRNYCRQHCLLEKEDNKSKKYIEYKKLMSYLTLDKDTYLQLKDAFMGGYTHASMHHSRQIMYNVDSFDFTSSYPYVMISERFPMSKAFICQPKDLDEFNEFINTYCCLFDIEFTNVQSIELETYISVSHCKLLQGQVEDNGRVVKAKRLVTTITEQDFFIIKNLYKWENLKVFNFRIFKKDYLPKDFVLSILKLYNDKTKLKDVPNRYIDYMISKENVNSCYGMCVTDICRDEISYDKEWESSRPNIEDELEKYNNSKKRFLYYPWGIWVTAYARRNLFTAICELKEDFIYADTDSVKLINYEKHKNYFEKYNMLVKLKLEEACNYHGIDFNLTCPKNIRGVEKQLGIWEHETEKSKYTRFKTLGAKRYLVEQDGKYELTISGVNKKKALEYMLKQDKDIFEQFDDKLCIPKEYSGKNIHTYIDDEKVGIVTDYLGKTSTYRELSSVHIEEGEYNLSMSTKYLEFILGIQNIYK